MKQNLSLRVFIPSLLVGSLLLVGSVLSLRYMYLLQSTSARILTENVTSLEAAQELEIQVRQLRFHNLLYLVDPSPERLVKVHEDEERFEKAMAMATDASTTTNEIELAKQIQAGFIDYKDEQARLRESNEGKAMQDAIREIDSRPVGRVVDPCRRLFAVNRDSLAKRAERNRSVAREAFLAMLFLGVVGPIAGLVAGFSIARRLKQSIYRLSVQVRGMSERLDRDVGLIDVTTDGDLDSLETQIQNAVKKVEQAAQLMQQQQRELLRAEQLSQVGQLAAGVAHEIRNPLTGIKLLVDAALRPTGRRSLEEKDLQLIRREVRRMEHAVQTLLDFARLSAPEPQVCDVRNLVDQAWELVRFRCEQQNVSAKKREPEEPATSIVDAGQITAVLVNLMLNALDAMPAGGDLETEVRTAPTGEVEIRVHDTGPGIAPAVADRLFTPFATTKANGTGLGLFLSKKIVEEHGGSIAGGNRDTGGAWFAVRIPSKGGGA